MSLGHSAAARPTGFIGIDGCLLRQPGATVAGTDSTWWRGACGCEGTMSRGGGEPDYVLATEGFDGEKRPHGKQPLVKP